MRDLVLAILHHILAFGLVAMLMAENVLVNPGMTSAPASAAGSAWRCSASC